MLGVSLFALWWWLVVVCFLGLLVMGQLVSDLYLVLAGASPLLSLFDLGFLARLSPFLCSIFCVFGESRVCWLDGLIFFPRLMFS